MDLIFSPLQINFLFYRLKWKAKRERGYRRVTIQISQIIGKKVLSHINGDKDVKIYKIHKKKYHSLFYSSMKKVQYIMCLIVMVDFEKYNNIIEV